MDYNEIFTILKNKRDTDALLCAFSGKGIKSYNIFKSEDSRGYTFTKYEDSDNKCIDFKVFLGKNQNMVVFMPYIYRADMNYESQYISNLKWYISSCLDSYGIKKYNYDSTIFPMQKSYEESIFSGLMVYKFKTRIVIENSDQLLYLINFFNELNKIVNNYFELRDNFKDKDHIKNIFHKNFIKNLK